MTKDDPDTGARTGGAGKKPALCAAARRALREAQARRAAQQKRHVPAPREIDGRGGLDPVRYGDWEVKGRASDF